MITIMHHGSCQLTLSQRRQGCLGGHQCRSQSHQRLPPIHARCLLLAARGAHHRRPPSTGPSARRPEGGALAPRAAQLCEGGHSGLLLRESGSGVWGESLSLAAAPLTKQSGSMQPGRMHSQNRWASDHTAFGKIAVLANWRVWK